MPAGAVRAAPLPQTGVGNLHLWVCEYPVPPEPVKTETISDLMALFPGMLHVSLTMDLSNREQGSHGSTGAETGLWNYPPVFWLPDFALPRPCR